MGLFSSTTTVLQTVYCGSCGAALQLEWRDVLDETWLVLKCPNGDKYMSKPKHGGGHIWIEKGPYRKFNPMTGLPVGPETDGH